MHLKFIINVVSRILLIVCFLMMLPLAWAAHDNIYSLETASFELTILVGILIAITTRWLLRLKKEELKRINPKDGLAIVGISWIVLSAYGAIPLYISNVTHSYTDAFFEIASGFTTTGATIFTDVEVLPRGILFWRSLTHWLGGMGIIVLYVALLPALGVATYQIYKAEAPGLTVERVEPRLKETAKNLWSIYFILTLTQVVLLKIFGMTYFDALCHTFGTVATGGFSTKNASIGAYSPQIQWIITFFMFLAGINFILHFKAHRTRSLSYFENEEFRIYFYILIILIPVFSLILFLSKLTFSPVRDSAFQIVSILTTTGYATANFDLWPHALRMMIFILMFLGGCGGSTGGGLKIIRVFVSIKAAIGSVVQTMMPNAIVTTRFNGKALPEKLIFSILSYFTVYILLFFMGAVLLTITEACDVLTALTASLSALSNVGPGLNGVGPMENFAWFSNAGKWLLIFLMLAGRLELYAILILFIPSTWRK